MDDWKFGPPVLVGERVLWVKNSVKPTESGVVRWIGKLSKESGDWTVGIELDNTMSCGGTDGSLGSRKLFHCHPGKGVFLPLSRIRKEVTKETPVNWEPPKGRKSQYEARENTPGSGETDFEMTGRALNEVPKWTNNDESDRNSSSDSDELKSDIQSQRKSSRIRRKRNKSPRSTLKKDELHLKREIRRPFSITGRLHNSDWQSKHDYQKKHESCALEEKYIREFIQREIHKHQDLGKMNGIKGNFKKIDEDDIHIDTFQYGPPKKFEGRVGRRSDAYHRREKPNGFFSFLKWFKKSKEMPELEGVKDSSVTSSPLFIRRRSSSCGSVDTLFSIATANSFAFVSPVQYQAVVSSTHTTYPVPLKSDDETKNKNQSDYENNPSPLKKSEEGKEKENGQCSTERRKKCRAPDPPRDISLPSTLEHKKTNEEDDSDIKNGHRRTVSESFKDKKAGFYCHVQGKRKAPLPPSSVPLYPSLTSLKGQCPSISKKKRPAPSPPDRAKETVKNETLNSNYDNIPYESKDLKQREFLKPSNANLTPLLGLNNDISSSPLPSRPWYKRSSSGSNILKKESGEKKKNKENEEWMPEVGFSRRPISNDSGHNLFNLLSRLDKNQDKKKEEKRKSQISILANISELDREAAEIIRKEHAQEKKLMEDKDEMYYSPYHENNISSSFPNIQNTTEIFGTPVKTTKSPFDEFKPREEYKGVNKQRSIKMEKKEENKREEGKGYDASAELDYYINPWNCPKCTLENPGWEKFCEACNTMRLKFKAAAEASKSEAEEPEEAKEEKPKSPNLIKSKSEEVEGTDQEEPSEDNLEGVRRKRLAFFTSKQSSLREEEDHEKAKLKIMLKEMKNSLPKREKGVINNATGSTGIDPAADTKNAGEKDILESPITSEVADSKEFSKSKVQQTWQSIANDPSKYGAIKKAKQHDLSSRAEAICVTKTTILEDVLVKKPTPKVSTSVQTASTAKNENSEHHFYANIQNIKGVLDLSTPENTITKGDIDAVTPKVQNESGRHISYKVDIQGDTPADETNTLDINRLLRKLEAAINTGQHLEAANIAKELARMKVNCSVKRQKIVPDGLSKFIVDLYIEDKLTHKGPIQIQILPNITLGQLKMRVEREWNIPRGIQRWILGKQLAIDDSKTLEEHGVVNNSCPLFLYIVTPENPGLQAEGSEVLKNVQESHTRNGKVAMYAEARRPSLIIEEDSESGCEQTEDNVPKKEEVPQEERESPELPKISATGAKKREMFERRDSQSSFSFEKSEMNELLKKELKMISLNSVKDRIEKLNRAATGATQDGQKGKGDTRTESNKQKWHYNELMQLENTDLVPNVAEFECPICLVGCAPGEGVVLKDCLHIFCRSCLVNTIQYNEEAEVKCPYRDNNYSCESVLQQREIKSLVPKGLFEQHLAKSVSVAENNIRNTYHCKTPDCKGWCILEDNVNEFRCPVCRKTNCLTCQAIHTGLDCRQYQEQLEFASDTNVEARKTRDMLQEMVEKGEAMACPTCQVVLMKKWGCDWLRCSMCKTEICWVTRGPRWGPGGKGDTSSGCQCGVNGVKCHPKCNYCH